MKQARSNNRNRHVATRFADHPSVLDDDGTGIVATQKFFEASETVVITDDQLDHQLRAASIAVVSHAPMLTMLPGTRDAIVQEITRLNARYILLVGDVSLATATGTTTVLHDPLSYEAIGEMTAFQFEPKRISRPEFVKSAVTALSSERPTLLVADWLPETQPLRDVPARAFPAQSKRDASTAPIVIASQGSSIAAITSARSFGAEVRFLEYPDPRDTRNSLEAVAGLGKQPLIALGKEFGTDAQLQHRIELGERASLYQPGNRLRGLIFPKRRLLATTIDMSTTAHNPATTFEEMKALVSEHTRREDLQITPVIMLQHADADRVQTRAWLTACEEHEAYCVVAVDSLAQVQTLEHLLKIAHTGVFVTADAAETGRVAKWLAEFVAKQNLAQTLFISTTVAGGHAYDELAYVLLAAGQDEYQQQVGMVPDHYYLGLNLASNPAMSIEDVLQLEPRPWLIHRGESKLQIPIS